MSEPEVESPAPLDVPLAYSELSKTYNAIRIFRARLLGLLPLASGAGILALLDGDSAITVHLIPIGILGAIVTFGLALYEFHNMARCHILIDLGVTWEKEYGLGNGQFTNRPAGLAGNLSVQLAAWLVYGAVLIGWLYVALAGALCVLENQCT